MVDAKFDNEINVKDIMGYEVVSKIDSKIENFPFWALDKGKESIVADKKRIKETFCPE